MVIMEIPKLFKKKPYYHVSIQSKVAITVSLVLIIAGTLFFFFAEQNNALSGFSLKERILPSLFQSVTARTAGFNTVNIGSLATPTLFILIFFMFIGASPGSTGGGIKTCTFGVLLATAFTMIRNKDKVSVFKRTIPKEVVRKALVVLFLAAAWICLATLFLTITEAKRLGTTDNYFSKCFLKRRQHSERLGYLPG